MSIAEMINEDMKRINIMAIVKAAISSEAELSVGFVVAMAGSIVACAALDSGMPLLITLPLGLFLIRHSCYRWKNEK